MQEEDKEVVGNDSGNKGFYTASERKNFKRGEARRRMRMEAEESAKAEAIREVAAHIKFAFGSDYLANSARRRRRRMRREAEESAKAEAIREVAAHIKFAEDLEKAEATRAAEARDRATENAYRVG